MMKTLIFDFGGVLVDWNPHYLLDGYFGSREKADWFIRNICTMQWNEEMDAGKPIRVGVAERCALYPEYAKDIAVYYDRWIEMMGGQIEGMYDLLKELRQRGFRLYGLTNWASETFCQVRHRYPIFDLLEGMVVSGEEHCIKPDPRIFHILLDRYRLDPADCIFIDDRLSNVQGAEAVGIQGIQFTSAKALREALLPES